MQEVIYHEDMAGGKEKKRDSFLVNNDLSKRKRKRQQGEGKERLSQRVAGLPDAAKALGTHVFSERMKKAMRREDRKER